MTDGRWRGAVSYVMVRPDHFRVDYQINPFMDLADQPDPDLALAQWDALVATIERARRQVEVIAQRAGRARHGLRDEPRPRRRSAPTARRRPPRRDVAHALRRAPDGDRHRRSRGSPAAASPRRTSAATASAPTSRPATPSPWRRRAGRRLRPAHRGARRSSTWPPTSASGSAALRITHPGDVPPRPRLLPARRPPRDRLPGRVRRRVRRRAAGAGARAAGAHRGGGADDVLRQLDRGRPHRA